MTEVRRERGRGTLTLCPENRGNMGPYRYPSVTDKRRDEHNGRGIIHARQRNVGVDSCLTQSVYLSVCLFVSLPVPSFQSATSLHLFGDGDEDQA